MQRAAALVVPSIWKEMFGLVVIEAFANGLPVIASRIGALATLVEHEQTGLLVEPNDPQSLANAMAWVNERPEAMREMGRRARQVYEERFTSRQNYRMLLDIYSQATSGAANTLRSPSA